MKKQNIPEEICALISEEEIIMFQELQIKIELIRLTNIITIKRNNENISPFEKGLLFPTKFWLVESIIKLFN